MLVWVRLVPTADSSQPHLQSSLHMCTHFRPISPGNDQYFMSGSYSVRLLLMKTTCLPSPVRGAALSGEKRREGFRPMMYEPP